MTRRIVLDMSDLYEFFAGEMPLSGIQRVALNFAARLRKNPDHRVSLGYFDRLYGYYAAFPDDVPLDNLEKARHMLSFPRVRRFNPQKYRNKPLRRSFHHHRAKFLRAYTKVKRRLSGNAPRSRPERFSFEKNDVLLALGAGWDARESYPLLTNLTRGQIVTPVLLVHDVIPLLNIHERGGVDPSTFERWLQEVTGFTTRFVAYSEQTKHDLMAFMSKFGKHDYLIETFSLPHEFVSSDEKSISDTVSSLIGTEYVLSVGPLRYKNGNRLATAWAQLTEQIGAENMPKLVFAGAGSRSDLTVGGLGQIEDLMAFVRHPTDKELEELYRGALFTVFPSVYEGFGLPVAESHWFGKYCVASNASSIPEAGGNLCDYFDPYDIDDMAKTLRRPIVDRNYLHSREREIDCARLLSWEDSAEQLLAAVARLVGQYIEPPTHNSD